MEVSEAQVADVTISRSELLRGDNQPLRADAEVGLGLGLGLGPRLRLGLGVGVRIGWADLGVG